jgi:hypothetical protein
MAGALLGPDHSTVNEHAWDEPGQRWEENLDELNLTTAGDFEWSLLVRDSSKLGSLRLFRLQHNSTTYFIEL